MGVSLQHSLKYNILNKVWDEVDYLHVDNYQNQSMVVSTSTRLLISI